MGKAWEAAPGNTNNLAGGSGEIFLPFIVADTLKDVSSVESTVITFPPNVLVANPALAGVTITVPPNTLFSENGTRGGKVGIAPVPPDRLPEPLPPGLNLPLVITIQTDGPQNFDRPVPVRFPNLPDPVTGEKLGQGEKTMLWSFNHDTGHWEPQGTMTISADGNFAESDPGVGVRQPGWHGAAPGSPAGGPCADLACEDRPPKLDCEDSNANGICDYDDSKRCERDRLKTLVAGADCFQNFVPQPQLGPLEGCILAGTTAFSTGYRDCAIDPSNCGKQAFVTKSLEMAIDCAAGFIEADELKAIVTLGKQIKCVLDTGLAYENWQLCKNATPAASVHASATSTRGNPFRQQYEIETRLGDYFTILFGDSKWGEQVYLSEMPVLAQVLSAVTNAFGVQSPGGETVTAAERAAIAALPRPAAIDESDLNRVIDRLQGNSVDYAKLAEAADRLSAIMIEIQSEGWLHIYEGYSRGMALLTQITQSANVASSSAAPDHLSARASNPSTGTELPRRSLYYTLTDTRSGFQLRGRLNDSGHFDNVILRPLTAYSVSYFDPVTLRSGSSYFTSSRSGQKTTIPSAVLVLAPAVNDTDGDGLSDLAESALGTNRDLADSDNDGLSDQSEVLGGTNPMDGFGLATGVAGSTLLNGTARDIAIINDHAVVAMESGGLEVLSLQEPTRPVRVGTLPITQGQTLSVATDGSSLVAGNSMLGLLLIDLTDPAQPFIRTAVSLSRVEAVAVQGKWAYAGMGSGNIAVVDVTSGELRFTSSRVADEAPGDAIVPAGEWVYLLTGRNLFVYRQENGFLFLSTSLPVPGGLSPLEFGRKLFIAGNRLYAGYFEGFSIIDISNPLKPILTGVQPRTQAAIHDFAAVGPRLLSPIVSFSGTQTLALGLYDVTDPTNVTQFLTSFATPGDARAVAIHRGLAYVADGSKGVAVVNLLSAAGDSEAPSVQIADPWSTAGSRTEPGSILNVPVDADDKTLVREVALLVDGAVKGRDGSYPFGFTVTAPAAAPGKTGFTLQAIATDLAGNSRTSAPVTVTFATDATAPQMISAEPPPGSLAYRDFLTAVVAEFDETVINLPPNALRLFGVGPDRLPNTTDDIAINTGAQALNGHTLSVALPSLLAAGDYYVQLAAAISDAAGNARQIPIQWPFTVSATRPALSAVTPSGLLATPDTTVSNIFALFTLSFPPDKVLTLSFTLSAAGADARLGTADDLSIPVSLVGFEPATRTVNLRPATPLPVGLYRLRAAGPVFTTATADFQLKDPRNFWKVDRGGFWNDNANWTYPVTAGNDLIIDRPGVDLITTNRSISPLLRSIYSSAKISLSTGALSVLDEAVFDGPAEITVGNFDLTEFRQGTFRFRGGLDIISSSASNIRLGIYDATIVNEATTRWLKEDIESSTNAVFFNTAGAVFEIGEQADDWVSSSGGFTAARGKFVNAGLIRKPAGTNQVNITGVVMQNDGQILLDAGLLELYGYRGNGSVVVGPNATLYVGTSPTYSANARFSGAGTVYTWGFGSTSARQLIDINSAWEIQGTTMIVGPGVRFPRPLNLPTATFEVSSDLVLDSPSRLGTLRVHTGLLQATVNAPLTVDNLHFRHGNLAAKGPITVNQSFIWEEGAIQADSQLELHGVMSLTHGALGPFTLRLVAASNFLLSNSAPATLSAPLGSPARLWTEGILTKTGTGTVTLTVALTNTGSIRVVQGAISVQQITQNPSGELLLAGAELRLNYPGIVELKGAFGGAGTLSFPAGVFNTRLSLDGELRFPAPGSALTVLDFPIELKSTSQSILAIDSTGAGLINGTVRPNNSKLRVQFASDYDPPIGTEWKILTAYVGSFGDVESLGLVDGKQLELDYTASGVILRVTN